MLEAWITRYAAERAGDPSALLEEMRHKKLNESTLGCWAIFLAGPVNPCSCLIMARSGASVSPENIDKRC